MKTIKRILWAAALIMIVGTMLTTCHSCGKKDDTKPTTSATEAQKRELEQLKVIASQQRQIDDLQAQLANRPIVQPSPAGPSTSVFTTTRINTPSKRDSQAVLNLKAQIRALETKINIKIVERTQYNDAVQRQVGLANINELNASLQDMKNALSDMQAAQR